MVKPYTDESDMKVRNVKQKRLNDVEEIIYTLLDPKDIR